MLYVRLMNSFEAVYLDQLDDPAKTGLHIGRQRVEFISNAIVEQSTTQPSNDIIAFLQCREAGCSGALKMIDHPVLHP